MKKVYLSILLLSISGVLLLGQPLKLSREKQILVLHNTDSLLHSYEFYSTISEGISVTENQKDKFLKLFRDTAVIVFDDISPNYVNNNENTIIEKQKPVWEYAEDIGNYYVNLICNLTETDAGSLFERLKYDQEGLYVLVKVKKVTKGYTLKPAGAAYETITYQNLMLRYKDTVFCEPIITEIVKAGISTWDYQPPPAKASRWEQILFVRSGLYNMSFSDHLSLNKSIILDPEVKSNIGFGLEGDFRYLFEHKVSYSLEGSIGLGLSYFSSVYSAKKYVSTDYIADKYNDPYFQIMDLNTLSEKQTIIGIDIPFKISFDKNFNSNNGLYFGMGAILSYYTGQYKTVANYSSLGNYPQYNITFLDLADLGFNTEKPYSNSGKLPINPINIAGNIEFGLIFKVLKSYQLYAGLNYSQTFLNFSKKGNGTILLSPDNINPTNKPVYNSIISEMGNINLSFVGIKIGIKKLSQTVKPKKNVKSL